MGEGQGDKRQGRSPPHDIIADQHRDALFGVAEVRRRGAQGNPEARGGPDVARSSQDAIHWLAA